MFMFMSDYYNPGIIMIVIRSTELFLNTTSTLPYRRQSTNSYAIVCSIPLKWWYIAYE